MLWWIIAGSVAVLAVVAIVAWRRRGAADDLTSIVMLRSEPASVNLDQVRAAAKAVFKDDGEALELPAGQFPPGLAGGFAVTLAGAPVFYVINAHRPYVPDPRAESAKFPDARAREAFSAHKAWVSVDVIGGAPDASMQKMILLSMGAIAMKLMDGKTSLLYATWLERAAFPSDMKKAGATGDLNAVFAA